MWELCLRFFSSIFSFCKIKSYCQWKCKFYRLCVRNPASGLLQIGHKSEKWQWRQNLLTWRRRSFFWRWFVSLVKFSYWFKFHVNIIAGSRVMTISFYKRLARNPKIGNTSVWVLTNIWGELEIPNLARMSLMKCYKMLQNSRVTAFALSELLRENQQGGG